LYNYVQSKQDLLYAILDHAMAVAERHLDAALDPALPVREQLRQIIAHHVRSVLDESPVSMAVFFQEVGLVRGALWCDIAARRERHQEPIVAVFRDAAAAGVIDTPDPRVSAYAVLGMCNWLHRWYRPRGSLAAEQIAEHYADLALRGLLTTNREPRD